MLIVGGRVDSVGQVDIVIDDLDMLIIGEWVNLVVQVDIWAALSNHKYFIVLVSF